jgi:hypothetical protein
MPRLSWQTGEGLGSRAYLFLEYLQRQVCLQEGGAPKKRAATFDAGAALYNWF